MPVCSNCGGNDFVWAENLRTGGIGRGGLSLRSGGELALGTRVCRGCGHADLFVKDPTVLRQPHTWKPGEFVPILPRSSGPPKPAVPAPEQAAPPRAPASPPTAPASVTSPSPEPAPRSNVLAPPVPKVASTGPDAPASPPTVPAEPKAPVMSAARTPAATAEGTETERKRPSRRKSTKAKAATPPIIHE